MHSRGLVSAGVTGLADTANFSSSIDALGASNTNQVN